MPPVILCPACDLAHRRTALPLAGRTRCARCHAPLERPESAGIDTAIALAVCSIVLFWLANAYPLVEMHVNGSSRETTFIGAASGLYDQGYSALAVLVLLTTVASPLLQVAALLYVLVPLRRKRSAYGQSTVIRVVTRVRPWSFIEVFMLGALVALVRLSKFATVVPGIALWSSALLILCMAALTNVTSPEQLWRWTAERRP